MGRDVPTSLSTCAGTLVCVWMGDFWSDDIRCASTCEHLWCVFMCFTALKCKPGCDFYGMCHSRAVFAANNISDDFSCHCSMESCLMLVAAPYKMLIFFANDQSWRKCRLKFFYYLDPTVRHGWSCDLKMAASEWAKPLFLGHCYFWLKGHFFS